MRYTHGNSSNRAVSSAEQSKQARLGQASTETHARKKEREAQGPVYVRAGRLPRTPGRRDFRMLITY